MENMLSETSVSPSTEFILDLRFVGVTYVRLEFYRWNLSGVCMTERKGSLLLPIILRVDLNNLALRSDLMSNPSDPDVRASIPSDACFWRESPWEDCLVAVRLCYAEDCFVTVRV